jgi:hypothetical protein
VDVVGVTRLEEVVKGKRAERLSDAVERDESTFAAAGRRVKRR